MLPRATSLLTEITAPSYFYYSGIKCDNILILHSQMKEKEIVEKLKNQDTQAIEILVRAYQHRVINLCYRFLQNREDAEDTAQEVFIELCRSIVHFRRECKLSTWIYQIAVSKSLDQIRKKKRKKRLAFIQSILLKENQADRITASAEIQPEFQSEKKERLQILQQAINSLSQNQRIAITLSKIEGLANKEAAEIMGLSISSVESLIFRAKANLKKILYKYFEKQL